jgi:hypothetical protein
MALDGHRREGQERSLRDHLVLIISIPWECPSCWNCGGMGQVSQSPSGEVSLSKGAVDPHWPLISRERATLTVTLHWSIFRILSYCAVR